MTELKPIITPAHYICSQCGKSGVRLWRQSHVFLNCAKLLCAKCGKANQRVQRGPDWLSSYHQGTSDQLGSLIPAVPCGDTYWGYTSVPDEESIWWEALPEEPIRPQSDGYRYVNNFRDPQDTSRSRYFLSLAEGEIFQMNVSNLWVIHLTIQNGTLYEDVSKREQLERYQELLKIRERQEQWKQDNTRRNGSKGQSTSWTLASTNTASCGRSGMTR